MKFIFASYNNHKVKEVQSILGIDHIVIDSLRQMNYSKEIVEDGASFEENAWIKTNQIVRDLGGNVIGEDSGLEVDSLDGAPGIYSARYSGPGADADKNMQKLLKKMEARINRKARFVSVLAVWCNGKQHTFRGTVEGRIDTKRTGEGGFGYDPLFIPDGYEVSFGSLSEDIKNKISHRARSLDDLRNFLSSKEFSD